MCNFVNAVFINHSLCYLGTLHIFATAKKSTNKYPSNNSKYPMLQPLSSFSD